MSHDSASTLFELAVSGHIREGALMDICCPNIAASRILIHRVISGVGSSLNNFEDRAHINIRNIVFRIREAGCTPTFYPAQEMTGHTDDGSRVLFSLWGDELIGARWKAEFCFSNNLPDVFIPDEKSGILVAKGAFMVKIKGLSGERPLLLTPLRLEMNRGGRT
jgi:hypothetical protein